MSARDELEQARLARNAARSTLDGGLAALRAELDRKGLGQRVTDDVAGFGADMIGQGVEIARENKPVVAATLGALALWFLRAPLTHLAARAWARRSRRRQDQADA